MGEKDLPAGKTGANAKAWMQERTLVFEQWHWGWTGAPGPGLFGAVSRARAQRGHCCLQATGQRRSGKDKQVR